MAAAGARAVLLLRVAAAIAPSNLPAGFCSVPQTVDLVVSTNRQFNTADGGDCSEVVAQPGALDLCVVRQRAITIASGATISHGLAASPTSVQVTPRVAGRMVTLRSASAFPIRSTTLSGRMRSTAATT